MESLQPLITNRFWVLFGVAMLLIPLGWWLGVGDLKAQIKKEEDEINSAAGAVPKGNKHPNKDWIAGAGKVNVKRVGYYDVAAEELYKKQQSRQTWPPTIAPKFKNIPYLGKVPPRVCDEYADAYFRSSLPTLHKIVDPVTYAHTGKYRIDEETKKVSGKLVFPFELLPKVDVKRWDEVAPGSDELWRAQQDVWLLTQLLKAIANVNSDAKRIDTASIRQILHISLHGGTAESADGENGGGEDGDGGMPGPASTGSGSGSGASSKSGTAATGVGSAGGGPGMGDSGSSASGFGSIMLVPAVWFGKPRPLQADGGSSDDMSDDMSDGGGGKAAGIGMASGMNGGTGTAGQANTSPYVDENPEEPFKTRGFILVVLMKRREITRLQRELGQMSFPVEIKVVQHVDRDPDLRGLSIFRETGGEGAGVGGMDDVGPMNGGAAGGKGIIPPGGGAGSGPGRSSRGGPGGPAASAGGSGGTPMGLGGGMGDGGATGNREAMPAAVRIALEDHGLCYVSIAGLMTIYQPPKPKSNDNTAENTTPEQGGPKTTEPAKNTKSTNGESPKTKSPVKKTPKKTRKNKKPATNPPTKKPSPKTGPGKKPSPKSPKTSNGAAGKAKASDGNGKSPNTRSKPKPSKAGSSG